jgi:mannose-6-phosphate isomerase class I
MTSATKALIAKPLSDRFRRTEQVLAPVEAAVGGDSYCLYPTFPVEPGSIERGFDELAARLANHCSARIDGYVGVIWDQFRDRLTESLVRLGVDVAWIDVATALKDPIEVQTLVEPSLGGDDPLFGTRFPGNLELFYAADSLAAIQPRDEAQLTILYGCGAALVDWSGPLLYVDLPKNELQFRSRAGTVTNLGCDRATDAKRQYKRFYFVDWPVLNRHKSRILHQIDWYVDGQRPETPTFMSGDALRDALDRMSRNVFRARPWFEPGPWGGQWLKTRLKELPQDVPNYAWSFELISPENGLGFSDGKSTLEVSFDCLMFQAHEAVLGESAARFGYDFPIRFDFLDTFDGGNLSLQCHPRPDYIRQHFGEPFTQDETYYIVDCKPGAEAFLGFRQGVDPQEFRNCLEQSERSACPIEVEQFVNSVPVEKHDLLLIPSGTVHCSGENILVLEISATPYIFTFKMYDWQRLGLDGLPRPLNIGRAFENLCFERQGDEVGRQLLSQPRTIASGTDWQLVHLPTHEEHFYDIHRLEFDDEVTVEMSGSPHVLMLVEGSSLIVQTAEGMRERFHFVETFVVPAAAGSYTLINQSAGRAKVVKAFIKPIPRRGT